MKEIAKTREPYFKQIDLLSMGQEGYCAFRIPAIVVGPEGTVLAFCEGRNALASEVTGEVSDTDEIDMVLRRSFDNGKTWEPIQVVWHDEKNTCGNACPVVDRETGIIWLFITHNLGMDFQPELEKGTSVGSRTVWVTKSADEGATWSEPVEITDSVKRPDWGWYGTGPGVGIQLSNGRLVIPCHRNQHGDGRAMGIAGASWPSHLIYSDDHGKTWQIGGSTTGGDECQVVELVDGTLLLSIRDFTGQNKLMTAKSYDKGLTWSDLQYDSSMFGANCQISTIRFTDEKNHDKNRILFSNPVGKERERMTVHLSYDEGESWPVAKLITPDLSGYSCLTILQDGSIGCLYERGTKRYSDNITLAIFNLEWLSDGADRLEK